jgi:FkbM family methyltransferase
VSNRKSQINRQTVAIRLKAGVSKLGPFYTWLRRSRAYARYLARRPHDPDFRAFGLLEGDGLFLDIGASIGQSALSFRIFNRKSPILSLEPLAEHEGDLRFVKRVIRGYEYRIAGAGSESGTKTIHVPTMDGYALPAESSLSRAQADAVLERLCSAGVPAKLLEVKEQRISLLRVDELGLKPGYVKIDVEGAEDEVLAGMEATIQASRPFVMIERSDASPNAISRLERFGYRPFIVDTEAETFAPYEGQDCGNIFLLP